MKNPCVCRCSSRNIEAVSLSLPAFQKHYITVHPAGEKSPFALFETLAEYLAAHRAQVVVQDVFGACSRHADGLRALAAACGPIDWPVTWIQGDSCSGDVITGTQVYAVSRLDVQRLRDADGRVIGAVIEDANARFCLLGDLRPPDLSRSRPEQTYDVFLRIEQSLALAGMTFANVVRTWLYIDRILDWYGGFNEARTRFFNERGVFDGLLPASTGIGVRHPGGGALVADVAAIQPKHAGVTLRAVESPLQCPAPNYRSSFSRAAEVDLPDHRRLYISGTASIGAGGRTVYVGNVEKQIRRSMEVVEAILESRGMTWCDVSRAAAYFRSAADAPKFQAYCRCNHLSHLPIAIAHSDICRDDLLFEIEVDAVAAK